MTETTNDWARVQSAIGILETIELGLARGYTPAELLDENSPIRDRMRTAVASSSLCNDEGCPHSGTPHVCTNVKLDGEQALLANELLELATDSNTLEALLRELVWWRDTHGAAPTPAPSSKEPGNGR